MSYREIQPACPRCRLMLVEEEDARRCPGCGGCLMDERAVRKRYREACRGQREMPELVEFPDGSPKRGCPTCGTTMEQVWLELLALDRCGLHGIWLDPGELELVLRHGVEPGCLAVVVPPPKPPRPR